MSTRTLGQLLLIGLIGSAVPAAGQVCKDVSMPLPLRTDPLPSLGPAGRIETTSADGFTDDYLYSPDDAFKIGTRREWGSTVIFFGEGGTNLFVPGGGVTFHKDSGFGRNTPHYFGAGIVEMLAIQLRTELLAPAYFRSCGTPPTAAP